MSGDEKNPKNPDDESQKGKSGDEMENDNKERLSNKEKKGRNDSGEEEREAETSDDEMSYEK